MTEYRIQFQVCGEWYSHKVYCNESDAVDEMKKLASKSNMAWRVRRDEIISTIVATSNEDAEAKK